MRQGDLSVDKELLQVALIIFSAVSLATLEFIKNAFPAESLVQPPKSTVVYVIILVQVVPAVLLFLADRAIAARDTSGRMLRLFRTAIFAVAIVLILRQLQLYWGPAEDLTESVRSVSAVLLAFASLVVIAGVVWLSVRLFRGVVLFFYYMSPVAIAMTAIVPFQVPTGDTLPEAYVQEVERAEQSGSREAVFILILDELAYDVLAEEGELDGESFPNFAALAEDGVWFTNATSNQFWTWDSIPNMLDPVTSLVDRFDIRLYSQYPRVEDVVAGECGKTYTCRGARYLSENERTWLASNLVLRSFYQATPDTLDAVLETPAGWLVGGLDSAYPTVDPVGWHTFTKKLFDTFLNDVEGPEALGRIHVLHLLLPHSPLAFNERGQAITSEPDGSFESLWEKYRSQTMFADSLLGRLIDKLKDEGIYDESVIAVTSDHGLRNFSPSLEKPPGQLMVQVPLLIRAPGLDSQVSDVDYQHIDFGATLMDVLGVPPPEDTEGVSAFSLERPQRDKVFHMDDDTYIYNRKDDRWALRQ